ncbi:uncharacterized protein LOC127794660 [Diospyros lotus]|uniref:uncharacterized protein LOC127794660 n=1 Tax=Diospyros lotus TaxID=55363 RepID=UPI00225950F8|nr:uncharacterized protein LOC127794660 [Diospyros lotus]
MHAATATVRLAWKRALATSICVYVVMLGFVHAWRTLVPLLEAQTSSLLAGFAVGIGVAMETYLAAVLSLAMVVSILEDRAGWEAVRIGSGLMEGRRISGWVLSGGLGLVSGMINRKLEEKMEGQDVMRGGWTAVMKWLGENAGLVGWFGLVVEWSYIVTSVFYFESRRRKLGVEEEKSSDAVV